jgi:hypothetical protein
MLDDSHPIPKQMKMTPYSVLNLLLSLTLLANLGSCATDWPLAVTDLVPNVSQKIAPPVFAMNLSY